MTMMNWRQAFLHAGSRLFGAVVLAAVCLLSGIPQPAHASASQRASIQADNWITHPEADAGKRPIVLQFAREWQVSARPAKLLVEVTADNRFILFVNGKRVAAGPSAGDVAHWRYSSLDLAPYLVPGVNSITAIVWNAVKVPPPLPANATQQQRMIAGGREMAEQTAPLFQQSVATGFRLIGHGAGAALSTGKPGWRVRIDSSRTFTAGFLPLLPDYYVAGSPETIDAGAAIAEPDWREAEAAPAAARRTLVADRLPPQLYSKVPPGEVVRSDLDAARQFPARPVTIPANSRATLLLRRDAMVSAYPSLQVSGGRGATIKATYAEALVDANGKKGDRDLVDDRKARGLTDTFKPDGRPATFSPLWWRTWRYLQLEVTTGAQPMTLEDLAVHETGYPFKQVGRFASSDPQLDRIWQVGWRTALVDAHETYMDSAFWEQLQYVGDTRLQMLISYAVSGDPRLAEQAIDAFAQSRVSGGLTEGAYPSRGTNPIAPFSLLWIAMLDDWRMQQPNKAVIVRHLPRMREVLHWFEPWLSRNGLLTRNPEWNFVDWVGQSAGDRKVFPSYGAANETCLVSAIYLGALQQAARLERHAGDRAKGRADDTRAAALAAAIREHCWSAERALFADNPDKQVFSQQMNALAVLYGLVPEDQGRKLLERIVEPGKGIDAPAGMYQSSYYFSWYLVRAFKQAGLGNRYHDLIQTWRDLLKLNYTTWPEERGHTRSDTHAWSAHPTADLLGIVAGIQPAAQGYAKVRVKPALGHLTSLEAVAATPRGPVRVSYKISGGLMIADVECPPKLSGYFEWNGKTYSLKPGVTRLTLVTGED